MLWGKDNGERNLKYSFVCFSRKLLNSKLYVIYLLLNWPLLNRKFEFDFGKIKFYSLLSPEAWVLPGWSFQLFLCFKWSKFHLLHYRVGMRINMMTAIKLQWKLKNEVASLISFISLSTASELITNGSKRKEKERLDFVNNHETILFLHHNIEKGSRLWLFSVLIISAM